MYARIGVASSYLSQPTQVGSSPPQSFESWRDIDGVSEDSFEDVPVFISWKMLDLTKQKSRTTKI